MAWTFCVTQSPIVRVSRVGLKGKHITVGGTGKARIHKTLRVTPAMEAGLSTQVWSVEEIVGLLG